MCIFPDGSECDEWAYFRGECGPTSSPTSIPPALTVDPADYQGWWTYTHAMYNFPIRLPEDWIVEETATSDPLMNGHILSLHPNYDSRNISIRMAYRRTGEDFPLWPASVGHQGEFIPQGTLEIAGQPARRLLSVCPTGEVTAIWYHNAEENQPNIKRGNMEFGFMYSAGNHCETDLNLGGEVQRWGEMIIASLQVPQ